MCNVLDKLPKKLQSEAKRQLREIVYAPNKKAASKKKIMFQCWCRERNQERAAGVLDRDWEQMVTFYRYPREHWKHIRTSNPAESPFAAVRLRTNAAKRFKKVENATAVIWKMLLIGERRFRRLRAPELMEELFNGKEYVDGIERNVDKKKQIA